MLETETALLSFMQRKQGSPSYRTPHRRGLSWNTLYLALLVVERWWNRSKLSRDKR